MLKTRRVLRNVKNEEGLAKIKSQLKIRYF